MSKKVSLGATVALVAITAAITVSLTYVYATNKFNSKMTDINERQAMYTKLTEIDQKARKEYIGAIDEKMLNDGICAGYVAGLSDLNGKYLSAEKYKNYLEGSSSRNIGVGIQTVKDVDGNMEVVEVMPNSPAKVSGILKGDVIIAIDGKEISRISYGEAVNQLNGTAGTTVKFNILRTTITKPADAKTAEQKKTEKLAITVTRAEYKENTLTATLTNGNVGFIRITEFAEEDVKNFEQVLKDFSEQNIAGLVIDVRNNSGGNMQAMAKILDRLVPSGNTVSSVDKQKKTKVEFTSNAQQVDLPISVMINQNTFGAAEIFAADIKQFKKGLLIGEKTAGYGTKQDVVKLSDGSAIIFSVANYLTANGKMFNGKGFEPDIKINLSAQQKSLLERRALTGKDDPQLQGAITALVRQGANVESVPGIKEKASESPETNK